MNPTDDSKLSTSAPPATPTRKATVPLRTSVDPRDTEGDTASSRSATARGLRLPLRTRVTISDVAKLCGVTPATVSRVLNRKKKFSASEEVRKRIFDTAEKLGYVPDLAARNLNRRQTHIIGVFASPQTHVAEGINASLLEGIAETLHAGNYDVFFELSAAANRTAGLPFWRFDGAILMQAPREETIVDLDRRRVPYICVNEQAGNPIACVLADDAMGMRRAVDHLAALGHKRIAYANAPTTYFSHYSVQERYRTLHAGVSAHGLFLVPGHDAPFTSAVDFLRSEVQVHKATAVITYDHHIAVALVGAATTMGLKMPHDFSLVCFNDVFPVSLLPMPLTAVAVSGREIGRIGADLLLNQLLGRGVPPTGEIRVSEDLIVRSSTAPPPATS